MRPSPSSSMPLSQAVVPVPELPAVADPPPTVVVPPALEFPARFASPPKPGSVPPPFTPLPPTPVRPPAPTVLCPPVVALAPPPAALDEPPPWTALEPALPALFVPLVCCEPEEQPTLTKAASAKAENQTRELRVAGWIRILAIEFESSVIGSVLFWRRARSRVSFSGTGLGNQRPRLVPELVGPWRQDF